MSELENINNEEEYAPELIDLEDEEGNTVTFEIIDGMEFEGKNYFALIPYTEEDSDEESDDDEFVILKEVEKDGERFLASPDSEEENDKVGEAFLSRFAEMFDDSDAE